MKPGGYIALHRSLLEHPLVNQLPTAWFRVFVVILLKANWKSATWWDGEREVPIKPGQLVISVEKLSKLARVSVKQTRGCLKYLLAANTAAIETTSRYTVITLLNWASYQSLETSKGKPEGEQQGELGAKSGQSGGKVGATIEEGNQAIRDEQHHRRAGTDDDVVSEYELQIEAAVRSRGCWGSKRLSYNDRKICLRWQSEGVTIAAAKAAIVTGCIRKEKSAVNGGGDAHINSLAYFDSILSEEISPDQVVHLERRLKQIEIGAGAPTAVPS